MWVQLSTRAISSTSNLRSRLIKFRYGTRNDQQTGQVTTTQTQSNHSPVTPGEAIWDFQIPQRWKRKELEPEEIAVINNGGPL